MEQLSVSRSASLKEMRAKPVRESVVMDPILEREYKAVERKLDLEDDGMDKTLRKGVQEGQKKVSYGGSKIGGSGVQHAPVKMDVREVEP